MTSGGNRYPAYEIGLSAAPGDFLEVDFMPAIHADRPALPRYDQQVDSTHLTGWARCCTSDLNPPGFSQNSLAIFRDYPYGGLGEYMTAPQYALVRLPDNVTYDQAARFGYLGTAYSAMRKAGVTTGKTVLVNGISGTLGIGGALFGLAMGASRIFGTARNRALLERVKSLAPDRIEVFSLDEKESADAWVMRETGGEGVDIFIDCLGPGAPHETLLAGMRSLKRGGKAINIGASAGGVPMDVHTIMDLQQSFGGSVWFTAGEGQDMADMAERGLLNLSVFEQVKFPLSEVNEAISGIENRHGGFGNYVINP
jgi:threonine dehydrogenase-like Zn-dependent dehydrogenase